jgi:hypothetical protein
MKNLIAAAALFSSMSASAQDLPDGTVDVYFQQVSEGGALRGCSLVFTTVTRDFATLKGAQVILNGSFAFRFEKSGAAVIVGKLGVRQLTDAAWTAPEHFFFEAEGKSTAPHAKFSKAENEGYKILFTPLKGEVTDLVGELLKNGSMTIGFNRRPGGMDVLAPIRLNVQLTKDQSGTAIQVTSDETPKAFASCVSRLADIAKRSIK